LVAAKGGAMNDKPKRAKVWLSCLALLLAGLGAGRQVATWPDRLRYPGETDPTEGMRLVEMLHLRRGFPVYAPASPERFDAMIYGPLYYLLGARLIDPEAPAYLPLRAVSLLATMGSAAACSLLAFSLARSYLAAALAALLFLAYGFVTLFGASARSDSVALLLAFSGFLVAYRFRDNRKLLLAVPLILLGFYYKQQFVAGPLAILLYLVMEKRYQRAAEFAGSLAAGGIGLGLVFEFLAFRKQAFLLHFVTYNLLPWVWSRFQTGLEFLVLVLLVPILLAVGFLRSHADKLLSCYLGCACLVDVLAFGKAGSYTNYFFDCFLILSVLVACLMAERIGRRPLEVLVLLSLVIFLGQLWVPAPPQARDFLQDRAIQEFLRSNFPPRAPALGYYAGNLARAGLENPISDVYQYTQLIRQARLSDRDLRDEISHRDFGIIVVSLDLQTQDARSPSDYYFTEPVRRAILEDYRPLTSLDLPKPERSREDFRFYAWVPR
jgi:hypothetical protein